MAHDQHDDPRGLAVAIGELLTMPSSMGNVFRRLRLNNSAKPQVRCVSHLKPHRK